MHPFGGTPICPRCSRAVYAAEQAMGPGRKLYHKPCLACTICNKRLDSFTLLEHDQQPYCKACHLKNFGTRDLRHANLPVAAPPDDNSASSAPPSPEKPASLFPPQALLRPLNTGTTARASSPSGLPRLRPNRSLATSPISPTFPRGSSPHQMASMSAAAAAASSTINEGPETSAAQSNDVNMVDEEDEVHDALIANDVTDDEKDKDDTSDDSQQREEMENDITPSNIQTYPSNTGRPGIGTIPRTIPLHLSQTPTSRSPYTARHHTSLSVGATPRFGSKDTPRKISPPELTEGPQGEEEEAEAADVVADVYPSSGASTPQRYSYAGTAGSISRHSTGNAGFGTYSVPSPTSQAARFAGGLLGNGNGNVPMGALTQTPTGTRYGIALNGAGTNGAADGVNGAGGIGVQLTGSPRKWGASTPQCPRCGKSVYFAEQVKAVGKTFHKNCLRCTECSTTLDSSRLRDHDGDPFCVRCYGKNYGPQGGGYALLGKAGG